METRTGFVVGGTAFLLIGVASLAIAGDNRRIPASGLTAPTTQVTCCTGDECVPALPGDLGCAFGNPEAGPVDTAEVAARDAHQYVLTRTPVVATDRTSTHGKPLGDFTLADDFAWFVVHPATRWVVVATASGRSDGPNADTARCHAEVTETLFGPDAPSSVDFLTAESISHMPKCALGEERIYVLWLWENDLVAAGAEQFSPPKDVRENKPFQRLRSLARELALAAGGRQ